MVWDLIQYSREQKTDLSIVWLDLANAYGSLPHAAITGKVKKNIEHGRVVMSRKMDNMGCHRDKRGVME